MKILILRFSSIGDIVLTTPNGRAQFNLALPGKHNVCNALAAAAAAFALDIPTPLIARALTSFRAIKGRMQRHAGLNDSALIDDTYNANPSSMALGLETLRELSRTSGGRSIAGHSASFEVAGNEEGVSIVGRPQSTAARRDDRQCVPGA